MSVIAMLQQLRLTRRSTLERYRASVYLYPGTTHDAAINHRRSVRERVVSGSHFRSSSRM